MAIELTRKSIRVTLGARELIKIARIKKIFRDGRLQHITLVHFDYEGKRMVTINGVEVYNGSIYRVLLELQDIGRLNYFELI